MASLNITSLLKHIDELRIVLDGQPIDILAINRDRGGGGAGGAAAPPLFCAPAPTFCAKKKNN